MDALPVSIERYIDAYNRFDVAGMVASLTEDVVFEGRAGDRVIAKTEDRTAFEALATQGVAIFSERQQTVVNAIVLNDLVVVKIDYRAKVAVDLPNGWTKGQDLALTGISEFWLKDGQIRSILDLS